MTLLNRVDPVEQKNSRKTKVITPGQVISYRIEALRCIDDVAARLGRLTSKLADLDETAFWSPDTVITSRERVLSGLLDVGYDDDQKATESKQHVGACAVPEALFEYIELVNDAKLRFREFWSTIGNLRVSINGGRLPFLPEIILMGTEHSRINTHQLGRRIHTISYAQPLRMGFTHYDSPNPKRITKDEALNRIAKSLPEELHSVARVAFDKIAEQEDICLLRGNTPKARVNFVVRHGAEKERGQHPAVLPILYLDEGKDTKINYRPMRPDRIKRAPRRREAEPIFPGLEMYRYLPGYRFASKPKPQGLD